MIGVGITTFRRPDMVKTCWEQMVKHMPDPDGFQHVIHDDSETGLGVAASKNACIAYLMSFSGVDHIFLFDDDTWPIADDWWKPYVESGIHHLSYLFKPKNWDNDMTLEETPDGRLIAHPFGQGCMQYYTRECLETVGGMRLCFGQWGSEHLEHSHRIHNTGLTEHPFQGLAAQEGLFYASDEHATTSLTAVPPEVRREAQERNPALLNYWKHSEGFVSWG